MRGRGGGRVSYEGEEDGMMKGVREYCKKEEEDGKEGKDDGWGK